MSESYEFYRLAYELKYIEFDLLKEVAKWEIITKEEFKTITGQEYK